MTKNWKFVCQRNEEVIEKMINALDPRDAMTRGLTSQHESGKFLGDYLGIHVNEIQEVPANFDASASLCVQGIELSVCLA